jgi:hypothetical protein
MHGPQALQIERQKFADVGARRRLGFHPANVAACGVYDTGVNVTFGRAILSMFTVARNVEIAHAGLW